MSASARPPLLLALDTATSTASVALFDGQRVLSETTWLAGREHSSRLLVEVEIALQRVGRSTADLTGLVVARGPGSFTGVRVALSVAKGLAAGLNLPAWGIGSLDVLALAAGYADTTPLRAVLEAGRGRYATALYRGGEPVEAPRLATLEQLQTLLQQQRTRVIGELSPAARETLMQNPNAVLLPVAAGARRAGFLAELGWHLAGAGVAGDAAALEAVYVS